MVFWSKVLDILYPENYLCINCRKNYLFSEIKGICDSCLSQLVFAKYYCYICGRGLDTKGELCSFCQGNLFGFDMARGIGMYDGLLKSLLRKFKYEDLLKIKVFFINLLLIGLEDYYISEKFDKILAVPIHGNRMLERGYNQALILAKGLSQKIGIPLSTALKRVKDNPPLFSFAFKERRTLLKDSFYIEKDYFKGQTLLLVDDIFTTGATANEISSLLKEVGGAERVLVLTVATARTY